MMKLYQCITCSEGISQELVCTVDGQRGVAVGRAFLGDEEYKRNFN